MSGAGRLPIIEARGVTKVYDSGGAPLVALDGIDLVIRRGECVALMGPSGCGKSTLLHLCGAMDAPTAGQLSFDGVSLETLGDDRLTRLRRERIGFVFQFFNLLPTLTVRENVALPLVLAGRPLGAANDLAHEAIAQVGLDERAGHYPQQLSGGELQRCAIARAIVHRPALIIADEPTGSLDTGNGRRVLALLRDLHAATGATLLLATHAPEIARVADRVVSLRDGRIESDLAGSEASAVLAQPRVP